MDPHIRKEVSLDSKGPLGAISNSLAAGGSSTAQNTAPVSASEANSAATSRTGSRENLCEECIQNPLDLIDASIQVDLSDSESEELQDSTDQKEDAMGRSRRAGDLGVNKKGTPLYSREDIREQYCINDKELQVLDKSGRKGILGCFSNNGQAGLTPCTSGGGKGRKSILGSCIARTNSEEDLQELAKRPISPGHRGTTWNGRHYYDGNGRHPDEDEGFDEHYFRRRPKSVCMSANTADGRRFIPPTYGLPPSSAHLPPHNLGIPTEPANIYPPHHATAQSQEQLHSMTMAYGPHPLMRTASPYPPQQGAYLGPAPSGVGVPQTAPPLGYPPPPQNSGNGGGGYTLPPTVAYFPMTAYTNNMDNSKSKETVMMSQESLQQPNTPDLLMHRRQVETVATGMSSTEVFGSQNCLGNNERSSQKHVSFDSSSLMRSQTLATMDEASFQRIAAVVAAQNTQSPSKSSERLIDGRKTPDFEFYSQIFPPELARQIMLDRMKRNSMRTTATQTDRSRNSAHISSPTSGGSTPAQLKQPLNKPQLPPKVNMVSEGVQTNGFSKDQQTSPPSRPLPPYMDPPPVTPPKKKPEIKPRPILPPYLTGGNLPGGYQLQVYHLDGSTSDQPPKQPQSSWYGTAPRSGKHHHSHKHSHHNHKATRSHSSGNVLDGDKSPKAPTAKKDLKTSRGSHTNVACNKHLQKSISEGKLDEEKKPQKAVKFLQTLPQNNSAVSPSEDEVSDRDLPELAPISKEEMGKMAKKDLEEDEPDLGKTLSPLGSTSSLQDLIESSSARASADPSTSATISAKEAQSSTWIERERQKSKSVVVIEPEPETFEQENSEQDTAENSRNLEESPEHTEEPSNNRRNSESPKNGENTEVIKIVEDLEPVKIVEELEPDDLETAKTSANLTETVKMSVNMATLRMDSVISTQSKTSETATSEDYATAPEVAQKSEEDDEFELEKVEHYLESPEKTTENYEAVCQVQLKNNQETEIIQDPKSPTHSLATSSSSGSYSVHNTQNGDKKSEKATCEENKAISDENKAIEKRKAELKLDLDVNAPPLMLHNLPTATTTSEDSSTENSMIWQRLPMGSGDVKRKRQAFEQQIKAMSMEERTTTQKSTTTTPSPPLPPNGATASAVCKVARKIMTEESSPGLARSPAMHQGFRQEEWVVERTPVNTPDTANDKVVVAMINLSDEETSNHVDSDIVFKSSTAATTPQDGLSLMSSTQDVSSPPKESASVPDNLGLQQPIVQPEKKLSVVDPPAGFGDSPEHKKKSQFHEAVEDQPLPQEEQLLMASEEIVAAPSLHITEAFHTDEAAALYSVKKESITHEATVPEASTEDQKATIQTLDPPQTRKMSSTSSTSRPSSKNNQRSRSSSKERLLSSLAGSESAPNTSHDEDEVEGLYLGGYDKTNWAFIGKLASFSQGQQAESKIIPLQRSESVESTQSEREFRKKYQAITHRMVHRKSSAVMYSRILERTFECNKYVRVMRVRGEFGFRIHGSRPVVVSAIEPSTPAESSGLEVGDIILTINGINVLDLPHTEVVKTAQTGCDELELGLARVHDLSTEQLRDMDPMNIAYAKLDDSLRIIMSGYLWKLSRSMVPTTTPGSASALVSKWSKRFFVLRADSCLYFFKKEQESRPLGATLVSGCVTLTGCEDEDQASGVAKPLAFRLKWSSTANSILCLAADNQDQFDSWIHSITHVAQTPNEEKDDLWREMSRQKMKMSPVDFISFDCQGYLLKLDGKSKTWKNRFCLLCDAFLYLFTDKESESALATICLHGYRVQSTGNIGGNKKHTFELIPPDQNLKYFYFVADTETEKKRWMASLEYSIDRWMKLS